MWCPHVHKREERWTLINHVIEQSFIKKLLNERFHFKFWWNIEFLHMATDHMNVDLQVKFIIASEKLFVVCSATLVFRRLRFISTYVRVVYSNIVSIKHTQLRFVLQRYCQFLVYSFYGIIAHCVQLCLKIIYVFNRAIFDKDKLWWNL